MVFQTHIDTLLEWKPTESLIEKAKKATAIYNQRSENSIALYCFVITLYE